MTMHHDDARRLDLLDQQHELLDRMFMLHKGLTNYVLVSAHDRRSVAELCGQLRPWNTQDQPEMDRLCAEFQRLAERLRVSR